MINVGNPIIFINASDIGLCGDENTLEIDKLDILENIRCVGGVKMGLGKDINDMILGGIKQRHVIDIINDNTYNGMIGLVKFNEWKKV